MTITKSGTFRLLTLTMALLGCLAVVGSPRAEHDVATRLGLTKPSDFTPLARQGFLEHSTNAGVVNPPVDPATGNPFLVADPLGSRSNTDAWSMHPWDPPGAVLPSLFVGTNRNAGCFTDPDSPNLVGTCPVPGLLGIPALDQDDRAEIWRFTPDGFNNGRSGTWTRVHQSPMVFVLTLLMPRHIGYRSMIPCNAGGVERLYVSANGPRGEIISSGNGTTFTRASTVGLNTQTVSGVNADIGYGRIQCFTGLDNVTRLIMSPVGSLANNDAPLPGRAVILANNNPSNTSSPWLTISQSGFGNPNNNSIFNIKVFKNASKGFNYLYFGVMNNTAGAEIWRTAGCTVPPPGCSATYEKLLDLGGGRNELHPDPEPGEFSLIANQTVAIDMETLDVDGDGNDDYLYVALGHIASGNNDFVRAELIRFNTNDKTWELIAGKPRPISDLPILNFNCNNHIPDGVGGALAADANLCFPLSGRGEGMGNKLGAISPTGSCAADFPPAGLPLGAQCYNIVSPLPATYAYFKGPNAYFWNDEQCDTNGDGLKELYVGTLDRGGGNQSSQPRGADVWRTVDGSLGAKFQLVDTTGFGNPNNSGIRAMACTPIGLFVGTVNRNTNITTPGQTGGLEVHLGTCAPDGPLVADARVVTKSSQPGQVVFDGLKYIAYDDENYPAAGNGSVAITLDGSNSSNRFCGHPIDTYQWYEGSLTGGGNGTCAAPTLSAVTSGTPNTGAAAKVTGVPLATGAIFTDYTFTLKVTSTDATNTAVSACDELIVRASADQRPKATITVPNATVTLVDLDGNGSESVNLVGNCTDPEDGAGPPLTCVWSAPLPGTTFSTTACTTPTTDCQTTATVVAGFRSLATLLTATDSNGNTHVATRNISVRATRHDLAVTSVNHTTAPADENATETVEVTVKNQGDFTETNFSVTLADSVAGSTFLPPSYTVASLAAGATNAPLSFQWTPTVASTHTLTATAGTVTGETNTGNNTMSIQVAVNNVNDPPNANDDTATTNQGTAIDINVLGNDNDEDGDTLTVTIETQPVNGTAAVNPDKTVKYTPNGVFAGQDPFTYRITDPSLAFDIATVTVTVTIVPPTPPSNVIAAKNGGLSVKVTWTDGFAETRYEVRRCQVFFSLCLGTTVLTTSLPANSTEFINTPTAGTWRYSVRGCNTAGCTVWVPTPGALVIVP